VRAESKEGEARVWSGIVRYEAKSVDQFSFIKTDSGMALIRAVLNNPRGKWSGLWRPKKLLARQARASYPPPLSMLSKSSFNGGRWGGGRVRKRAKRLAPSWLLDKVRGREGGGGIPSSALSLGPNEDQMRNNQSSLAQTNHELILEETRQKKSKNCCC